jgi:hypothetical protein
MVFMDSYHVHNKVTRRPVTGMMIFVGQTPIYFSSKQQGVVRTLPYGAEFCVFRHAAEETLLLPHILHWMGVKV